MQNTIQIRKAKVHDSRIIADFNIAMAIETENIVLKDDIISKGVSNLLNQPNLGFYLIAEMDGQIVGSLMITYEWSDWRNGLIWWIQSVYVRPGYRRKGVYTALHEYVRNMLAEDSSIRGLRLYVEKNNEAARGTYESLGMYETNYRLYEEIKK